MALRLAQISAVNTAAVHDHVTHRRRSKQRPQYSSAIVLFESERGASSATLLTLTPRPLPPSPLLPRQRHNDKIQKRHPPTLSTPPVPTTST